MGQGNGAEGWTRLEGGINQVGPMMMLMLPCHLEVDMYSECGCLWVRGNSIRPLSMRFINEISQGKAAPFTLYSKLS